MQRVYKYLKQKTQYYLINLHYQQIKDKFINLNSHRIKEKLAFNWRQ